MLVINITEQGDYITLEPDESKVIASDSIIPIIVASVGRINGTYDMLDLVFMLQKGSERNWQIPSWMTAQPARREALKEVNRLEQQIVEKMDEIYKKDLQIERLFDKVYASFVLNVALIFGVAWLLIKSF